MPTWQCVKQCGACCHLDPADRPDLADYLIPDELQLYLSLVGEGGWCVNFDHESRTCRIYTERPRFCRVTPEVFSDLYDVGPEDLDEFAIECCQQQIEGVYGSPSPELEQFTQTIG
ncbi:YkgJ family cysteine cluster protein [Leptolyngbya sp. FACHB-261]|uniref:YkgJ family cysteine cluster protein n=1 Tax=Leptolyngbya sp. FACHB-261 TaxID=2692806 RepID=UPI001685E06F|nr:YkgJ family cysteine cluster protein [Leptolyngbya sp. FACHB-261]MBD2104221.1 YkgJ family cysteine cluster protein [Leptolyngbya sp. FACHB-261]